MVDFTLTANSDGSYVFDLAEGFGSEVTLSTADGQLPAGGPDPVQTLIIDGTDIVFFAVDPNTATPGANPFEPADIVPAILLGEPDLTEAGLEAGAAPPLGDGTFGFISEAINMNVSTSGIGVDNNVLQGGDNDPAIATGDESFVINPEPLLSGVKVFIDNSVGGYDPGPGPEFGAETLYYNVYFEDGTFTGPTAVFDPDLSPEAGRQVSFVIESEGSNLIDAVQLTMGEGAIKIPVIEFTTRDVALANDVFLDFSTTLTDADSDTASTDFGVDLYGNEVDAAFDYTLIDHEVRLGVTDDTADAFDVDVALLSTADYLIQGFDPDPNDDPGDDELYDQLYLLNGSNGFTLNTGSDLGVGDPGINDSQVLVDGVTVIVEDATLRDIIDITEADTLIV